jgi:hypothetical protein
MDGPIAAGSFIPPNIIIAPISVPTTPDAMLYLRTWFQKAGVLKAAPENNRPPHVRPTTISTDGIKKKACGSSIASKLRVTIAMHPIAGFIDFMADLLLPKVIKTTPHDNGV